MKSMAETSITLRSVVVASGSAAAGAPPGGTGAAPFGELISASTLPRWGFHSGCGFKLLLKVDRVLLRGYDSIVGAR